MSYAYGHKEEWEPEWFWMIDVSFLTTGNPTQENASVF